MKTTRCPALPTATACSGLFGLQAHSLGPVCTSVPVWKSPVINVGKNR